MKPLKQVEHSLHDLSSLKRGYVFWGMVGIVALAAVIVWLRYSAWLSHPNDVMLGASHDCFKNYMTSAWHVKHDSSYVHFGGMNYPFGEHVLFTDNQPAISAGMQWWSRHVGDISGNVVGILNIIQVISLLLGCGVVFLLLRKLHLPTGYAAAGALVMTFLAPQYLRFGDHFGLSHTFVIPLILYWLCRYEERESKRYQSLHIGFLVWFAAQLHFYYFGMAALFLTLYIGFQVLRDFRWKNIRKRMSHWVVMIIIPFVLLNIWIHWANYAPDRASHPYGFTNYIGYWEGVFLPYDFMPLHQWISSHLIKIRELEYEAKAYAGGLALFYTLWLLFSGFKMFGKDWDEFAYHRTHKHYLRGIFFAAFLLLLFACGFPFAIKGLTWMVDYMGPLRQFRGLGRFTWVYFYVINVLIFYGAWNWGRRFKGFGADAKFPQFRFLIWGIPLLVLAYEAYILQSTKKLEPVPNYADRTVAENGPDRWLKKVDFSPYQAIMPLPYYHIGSENIWKEFDANHYHRVTETAYHTGLPDLGVNMSRTPIGEMVKSVQLSLEPGEIPAILSDFPDKRPIALFVHGSEWDRVNRENKHLVSKGRIVYEDGDVKILRLELEDIRAYTREFRTAVNNEMDNRTLYPIAGTNWLSTNPEKNFTEITFDDRTDAKFHFQGKGAFTGMMGDTSVIWSGNLPNGQYTFSVWIKVNQDMGANHDLHVEETGLSDGHLVHHQHEGLRFHLKSIVNGWGLFEIGFDSREAGNIRIYLHKENVKLPFYADQALVKPLTTEVYRKEPGWTIRNNFWYRAE